MVEFKRQYCVGCHNQRTKTAGLSLDALDLADVPAATDIWKKAARKIQVGMMPPPHGAPRTDAAKRQTLGAYLTSELDRAAAASPNRGHPLTWWLNRVEYANARSMKQGAIRRSG